MGRRRSVCVAPAAFKRLARLRDAAAPRCGGLQRRDSGAATRSTFQLAVTVDGDGVGGAGDRHTSMFDAIAGGGPEHERSRRLADHIAGRA